MILPVLPAALPVLPEPRRDVSQERLPLATYAVQRALQGRPLFDELVPLRKADDTVCDTRALIFAGRGNVEEDLVATNFDSSRRTLASRIIAERIGTYPGITHSQFACFSAALAVTAGSGNCSELAAIAMRLHAGRLDAGQVVSEMHSIDYDHVWVEQSPAEGQDGPVIVIDPWMRGPAVLLEDARSLHNLAPHEIAETVSADEAPGLCAEFGYAIELAAAHRPEIAWHVASMELDGYAGIHPRCVFPETVVTSEAFQFGAIAAQDPTQPHSVSIAIVAAARAFGANVKGAAAFARDVIADLAPPTEP